MNRSIEKIKKLRVFLLSKTEGLSAEQLNTVPSGFNNNIIWNLAHLVSVQQSLCYLPSGLPTPIEKNILTPFMPGTKPEGKVGEEEMVAIKERLITSVDQFQEDYTAGKFTTYAPLARIKQVYDIEVNSIDDAVDFILYHEGFHIGTVLMLKHLV